MGLCIAPMPHIGQKRKDEDKWKSREGHERVWEAKEGPGKRGAVQEPGQGERGAGGVARVERRTIALGEPAELLERLYDRLFGQDARRERLELLRNAPNGRGTCIGRAVHETHTLRHIRRLRHG